MASNERCSSSSNSIAVIAVPSKIVPSAIRAVTSHTIVVVVAAPAYHITTIALEWIDHSRYLKSPYKVKIIL